MKSHVVFWFSGHQGQTSLCCPFSSGHIPSSSSRTGLPHDTRRRVQYLLYPPEISARPVKVIAHHFPLEQHQETKPGNSVCVSSGSAVGWLSTHSHTTPMAAGAASSPVRTAPAPKSLAAEGKRRRGPGGGTHPTWLWDDITVR